MTRREFLRRSGCGIGTAAALAAGIERFTLVNAMAQGAGYKALVCVFLGGGNDGNNMVIPADTTGYGAYAAVRGSAQLAIAQGSLLPITPRSLGMPFGFHPSLLALHPLFDSGNLAVVCNVGPLVEPLTKETYMSGGPRPYQLFSHSDQIAQWQTSVSTGPSPTGWGGRIADTYGVPPGLPVVTALAGGAFTRGQITSPLSVAATGALNTLLALNGFATGSAEAVRRQTMDFLRTVDRESALVRATQDITSNAVSLGQSLNVDPVIATTFPNTTLGNQLRQIAKLIRFNSMSAAPLSRQIFFCSLGGFDNHQGQVGAQSGLLTQVAQAMKAFYDSTVEMNLAPNVTTFTLSDFGRTFQPAGSGMANVGSDHAWGNHHLVMGGSVFGGDFYGVPGKNGTVFPTLELRGPDDTDTRGRWIPTSSVDQYAATFARWFDVDPGQINTIFPQLRNFSPSHLGFLP
ncbi:MAG TPA: DUF1501 domain-containing protein [Terriglobia bacterium]|nr:DUF1501 domain-containing protein [Terriglobia bacterium]